MAGNNKRKKKHPNILLILCCILLTAALGSLLNWYYVKESAVKKELQQISADAAKADRENRKKEETSAKDKKKETEAAAEKAEPTEAPAPTEAPVQEAVTGIACWGDDLINGDASATYSYMAVLQRTLQENGYDLPVVNKTLQGGGTLSMMKMAGVEDSVLQDYIAAHQQAAAGASLYVTETGIRDLTPEQLDRSDNGYLPIIFMGYYGGWNHDPAELAGQQEAVLNTFKNQDRFLVVGTKPVDEKVDAATLDSVMTEKWQEHYISLAEVCPYPASTYEAQDAMAKAIYQKLIDLQYIVK